jgi:protein tyrosine/serine phosphatase
MERHLTWEGCGNVRDLGGLGRIRHGALVRADTLQNLSAEGWRALERHGIRTVVDLRNPDEIGGDAAPRPPGLTTIRIPLDGMEDTEFWSQWLERPEFGTPHYYGPWLERFPDRAARTLAAIARAQPGGVAYHCGIGRDRTGLITMLILAALEVPVDVAAEDYALSAARVPVLLERLGAAEQVAELDDFYRSLSTTPEAVFAAVMRTVDPALYLDPGDLAALKARAL